MKTIFGIVLFAIGLLTVNLVSAVTVVLCEEENGERSYRERCLPGMTQVHLQKYYVYKEPQPTPPSVSFYFVPDCLWCREIREYFAEYEIELTEKDLTNNLEYQQELLDKAGELIVPTVDIEGALYSGYNQSDLDKELARFGYRIPAD